MLDRDTNSDRPVGVVPVEQEGCRDRELVRRWNDWDAGRREEPEELRPTTTQDVQLSLLGCLGGVAEHKELDPGVARA